MAPAPVVICGMVWCVWGSSPGHGGASVDSAATGSDGFCCHYPGHCKDWVCTYTFDKAHTNKHTHTPIIFSSSAKNAQGIPKQTPRNDHVLSMFRPRLHDLHCSRAQYV